jgi:hypothetical protein
MRHTKPNNRRDNNMPANHSLRTKSHQRAQPDSDAQAHKTTHNSSNMMHMAAACRPVSCQGWKQHARLQRHCQRRVTNQQWHTCKIDVLSLKPSRTQPTPLTQPAPNTPLPNSAAKCGFQVPTYASPLQPTTDVPPHLPSTGHSSSYRTSPCCSLTSPSCSIKAFSVMQTGRNKLAAKQQRHHWQRHSSCLQLEAIQRSSSCFGPTRVRST